ncbi:MAG: ATP-grasp domain-containing protein [Thermoleophilia bacterium]
MRVAILGQADGWHTRELWAALSRHGHSVSCPRITRLTARLGERPCLTAEGEGLDECDAVFVRTIPAGSLEQIVFRMDALRRLENLGVRVINPPACIERGVDKYYTAALLEDAGLPTPRTVVTERFDEALAAFEDLGGDVVVKPLFGSEGRGMVRVSDRDVAYRVLRALELGRYVFCLQEFLQAGERDVRVFVLDDEVLAGMVRNGRTWKCNVAQGGQASPWVVDDRAAHLALQAARAVGADYAGIDLLIREPGEYTVLEVNTIPGWRALKSVTGLEVADLVVQRLLRASPFEAPPGVSS